MKSSLSTFYLFLIILVFHIRRVSALEDNNIVMAEERQLQFDWDLALQSFNIAFDISNEENEAVFVFNFTGTLSDNKFLEASLLFNEDCSEEADATALTFVESVEGNEFTVGVDIIQSTIASSKHYYVYNDTSAIINFCLRVDYMYTDPTNITESINFVEAQVTIGVDLTSGFALNDIASNRREAVDINEYQSLNYPIDAYVCSDDNAEITSPEPLRQGSNLQICIKVGGTTETVYVQDILSLVLSQPLGPASSSTLIDLGSPDGLTTKDCTSHSDGTCNVKTQVPSKFFVDQAPNPLKVEGTAILAFGAPPNQRSLVQASLWGELRPPPATSQMFHQVVSDRRLVDTSDFSLNVALADAAMEPIETESDDILGGLFTKTHIIIIGAVLAIGFVACLAGIFLFSSGRNRRNENVPKDAYSKKHCGTACSPTHVSIPSTPIDNRIYLADDDYIMDLEAGPTEYDPGFSGHHTSSDTLDDSVSALTMTVVNDAQFRSVAATSSPWFSHTATSNISRSLSNQHRYALDERQELHNIDRPNRHVHHHGVSESGHRVLGLDERPIPMAYRQRGLQRSFSDHPVLDRMYVQGSPTLHENQRPSKYMDDGGYASWEKSRFDTIAPGMLALSSHHHRLDPSMMTMIKRYDFEDAAPRYTMRPSLHRSYSDRSRMTDGISCLSAESSRMSRTYDSDPDDGYNRRHRSLHRKHRHESRSSSETNRSGGKREARTKSRTCNVSTSIHSTGKSSKRSKSADGSIKFKSRSKSPERSSRSHRSNPSSHRRSKSADDSYSSSDRCKTKKKKQKHPMDSNV